MTMGRHPIGDLRVGDLMALIEVELKSLERLSVGRGGIVLAEHVRFHVRRLRRMIARLNPTSKEEPHG